ncbi:M48 family metalloprotease [Neptunicoccus cionae]|uniref:Peptidase M48 n=1 Tax=Neptunicoccus cionae TaxID=2035344 RepID=A0A916QSI4_9RHOB|nr:M48 family metalloprotease [Amylibacter cionae]GGA08393.1 peptidase M48 [Amylibacter cionae]
MRKLIASAATALLAACSTSPTPNTQQTTAPVAMRDTQSAVNAYYRVAARVEPVAQTVCRTFHSNKSHNFCDFQVKVNTDASQPPNAYQTIGRDGRPVITFNVNMLRSFRNDDEIAFVFGHEAGHQIARHIEQTQANQLAGAVLGGILVAVGGGDAQVGVDIGGAIGGRSYSKKFELEADTIAAHIADRAGYNATIGARTFERTRGSSALLATHPPSAQRISQVSRTIQTINIAKSQGGRAPVAW